MAIALHGRRVIYTDETEVTIDNVVMILRKALPYHWKNRSEIEYLWNYYKGRQEILNRVKQVRPEICNKIVENRANEIVSFKSGYLMGEPLQYVSRGNGEDLADAINQLNEYVFAEEKPAKDKELADWFHICGTSFRMALPDEEGEEDDSPFEIFTLDPRNTFVVYNNGLGNKPVLGVKYVTDEKGVVHYSCYSRYFYFEIIESKVVEYAPHILGEIPIIEYPLNLARIGAFELVIPLLDAINLTDSNRMDGVEQFIQALMLFHNVDISSEDFKALREEGAIKFKDIDPQLKAEVSYLINSLNQGETQTLVDHMYQTVLTICGMPSISDGSTSDSSNNGAVIMRNGWQSAEARAKDSELMFKKSERLFLKLILNMCHVLVDMKLKVHNIEIRFTRRNYENILQKAQVLDLMLKNGKVHPRLAYEHCGLFVDPDLAYTMSQEYVEEQEKKANLMKGENDDDSGNHEGNEGADRNPAEARQQSGDSD